MLILYVLNSVHTLQSIQHIWSWGKGQGQGQGSDFCRAFHKYYEWIKENLEKEIQKIILDGVFPPNLSKL